MPCAVIVGAQWGDEGKGKVVDYYAKDADLVVRYQGGCNAGHTVVVGNRTYKFHLIPSGVTQDKKLVIGNGVVVDLKVLSDEIDGIKPEVENFDLLISDRAHITLPFHRTLDGLEESSRGDSKVGTTRRGIGPTYGDKVSRSGLRMVDLLNEEILNKKLERLVTKKNKLLKDVFEEDSSLSKKEVLNYCLKFRDKIEGYIGDASLEISNAVKQGKNIIFEGAQGTLLDIDHGTYPFVTSSNPTAGGACTGSGIGPKNIDRIVGVMKGYITRVGRGPMPTELKGKIGERIREKGKEFGTTTGRPRRCGWLDGAILRYAVRVNSLDGLAITKLDVLGGLRKVKICTSYRLDGRKLEGFPASLEVLKKCKPVYEEFDGWKDLSEKEWEEVVEKGYSGLPEKLKSYLRRIEEIGKVPIYLVSLGPERKHTVCLKEIF